MAWTTVTPIGMTNGDNIIEKIRMGRLYDMKLFSLSPMRLGRKIVRGRICCFVVARPILGTDLSSGDNTSDYRWLLLRLGAGANDICILGSRCFKPWLCGSG